MYRIGIDVGGTFTDFLLVDESGKSDVYKTSTTPKNPTEGVLAGLRTMADDKGVELKEFLQKISTIVHGTTITTNATLTGEGANTGFITTKGFRDALNMRRGLREKQYDPKQSPPPPLVPRHLCQVVEERVNCEGQAVVPLNEDDVRNAVRYFKAEGVESIAVSLIFSFFHPDHELRIREIILEEMPEVYVSLSSEILPQVRVYERHSTTALNASVTPPLARYLANLQTTLQELGYQGNLMIMQSNGGVMSPEVASRFASNTLLSGPASGPAAGIFYTSSQNTGDIITVDMGGTSFDICLVKDKTPGLTTEGQVGGYRIASPMIDIHTIGAGGGSIAWLDAGGILRVGPKSAGAVPGPVCYGRGGTKPTVTDANLILGYLDPQFFHGGQLTLDLERTRNSMEEIADKLGMDVVGVAAGIYRIINANMADGVREVSVRRGHDPREFALVVAGGAGPIHAAAIAQELGISLIIVPRESSVFCAAGMLISDLKHDFVRTYNATVGQEDLQRIKALYREMEQAAAETLESEGIPKEKVVIYRAADLRYIGQFNDVEIAWEGTYLDDAVAHLGEAFHHRHETLYGYSMPGAPLEFMNLRVTAVGLTEKPSFNRFPYGGEDPSAAFKGYREVYFDGGFVKTAVYDGLKLLNGNIIQGPAIVEQPTTTIVITPQFDLSCDDYNNYVLRPKGTRYHEI